MSNKTGYSFPDSLNYAAVSAPWFLVSCAAYAANRHALRGTECRRLFDLMTEVRADIWGRPLNSLLTLPSDDGLIFRNGPVTL